MEGHEDPIDKAYYLSAAWGAVNHAFNIECSHDLALVLIVMQASHASVAARIERLRQGVEPSVGLPATIFERFQSLVSELGSRIEAGEPVYDLLASLAALGMSGTGNGFYLYSAGRLKI